MNNKFLIPILNKSFSGLGMPALWLSDKVVIEVISDEEYGVIFSQAGDEIKNIITDKTKCVKLLDFPYTLANERLQKESTV